MGSKIIQDTYADMLQTYGRSIQKLDVSALNFKKVTDMSFVFANCLGLKEVNLGENFDSSNARAMTGMFFNCENLGIESATNGIINFDKITTPKVQDVSYMFFGCCNIKELDLSKFNLNAATSREGKGQYPNSGAMFYDCTRLQKITIDSKLDNGFASG